MSGRSAADFLCMAALAWLLRRSGEDEWFRHREPPMRLRILVIDEDSARADALVRSLAESGYETVGVIDPKDDLVAKVRDLGPDLVIVDMESPSRDTLEDMRRITAGRPRPIVMFVDQSDESTTAEAMRLGISAYVIDGLNPARVKPILDRKSVV